MWDGDHNTTIKWLTRFCLEVFHGSERVLGFQHSSPLSASEWRIVCRKRRIIAPNRKAMTNDAEVTSELEKLIICALSTNFMQNLLVYYVAFSCDIRRESQLAEAKNSEEGAQQFWARANGVSSWIFIYLCRILRCRCHDKHEEKSVELDKNFIHFVETFIFSTCDNKCWKTCRTTFKLRSQSLRATSRHDTNGPAD